MSNFGSEFQTADARRIERAAGRAVDLSYESALKNGMDIPVGAVALRGDAIIGSGYGIDKQIGNEQSHAEVVAIEKAKQDFRMMPNLIVSTVEPCIAVCLNAMMKLPKLETVAFILPRTELSDRGLVNARPSIVQMHNRGDLPFNVVMLDDPSLYERALAPIDHTSVTRTPDGVATVTIDQAGVERHKDAFMKRHMRIESEKLNRERIG